MKLRMLPLLGLAACSGGHAFECGMPGRLCAVDHGDYLASVPKRWDGEELLPAFVHFHGHGGSAESLYRKESFTEPISEVGAIAIYPDGIGKSWNFRLGEELGGGRDEVVFTRQVITDALERFPVDPDRVVVSGFSIGASVAWEVACRDGELGTVFAPVSGAFWEPLPAGCPEPPQRLRHEHGTRDTVFPLEGRAVHGDDFRQGAAADAIDLLRQARGCMGEPRFEEQSGGMTCQVWDSCDLGGEVQFCLHDGDHRVRSGWHSRTLQWAFGEGS
jgi:polyhydroxybutyrate depolymerase